MPCRHAVDCAPGGHSEQTAAPRVGANVPAAQSVHAVLASAENVPEHATCSSECHAFVLDAGACLPHVHHIPAEHKEQLAEPGSAEKEPALHGVQLEAASLSAIVPGHSAPTRERQGGNAAFACCKQPFQYSPGWHRTQAAAPSRPEAVPRAQGVHAVLPSLAATVPAAQRLQAPAPAAAANEPLAHGVHWEAWKSEYMPARTQRVQHWRQHTCLQPCHCQRCRAASAPAEHLMQREAPSVAA